MSKIVRDPNQEFSCPRCGRPVTYKGRGRRPVWGSARGRVEASIERRGNRMLGVKPHVMTVVPPGSGAASGSRTNSNACGRAD
jgi:DNA-directed RNA polymerase subunit RPC12/RpoP